MTAWKSVPLHSVAEVSSGDGAPQESSAFGQDGVPFIRAGSLVSLIDGEAEQNLELIPAEVGKMRRMRIYPPNTVVFAKSGMSCTKGLVYELTGPAHVVNHLAAIQCGPNLSSRFLLRWFEINPPSRLIANPSYPSIKISDIRAEKIPLPLLAEQKRIAGILDAADALRAKRRAALAQLAALAQALFLDRFGDPVTNPKGWEEVPLNSICRPKQWPTIGKQDLLPSGFPVYGANGQIGYFSRFNHAEPTVLITCRGATCGTINVCEPNSYVTGNAMALDDPDLSRITIKFLESVLRITDFSAVITGVAQPQITRQSLAYLSIPVPPLPLQQSFAAAVEAIERQKARHREQLAGLDALFASLQHRAFRGEL